MLNPKNSEPRIGIRFGALPVACSLLPVACYLGGSYGSTFSISVRIPRSCGVNWPW